jgi:hypothetical protein
LENNVSCLDFLFNLSIFGRPDLATDPQFLP